MDVQPEAVQAAEAYEAMFVPALFAQWAPRVLDGVALSPGQRVLDVACGTGVLAREAARRVGLSGAVSGLDPAPGMLAVARRSAEVVDWREGVAESLPYADGQFDAVVSQFGLMFFADRVQALREMRRVLRPAGRLAVAVWSGLETMPALLREVAVVESVKAASDVYAPVTGSIVDVNQSAVDAPEVVNQDAYSAWLFKMKPAAASDLDALLDAGAYQQIVDAA